MRKKNKISKVLVLLMLIASMLGTCCVSAGAATVPYRTVQRSDVPVKVGNSYVWLEYWGINMKKSKNSSPVAVASSDGRVQGITNGSTIYYGSSPSEGTGTLLLGKYSIATGKHTAYKTLKGGGAICGYYNNKIYYYMGDNSTSSIEKFYSFDTKTKKTSLISKDFWGSFCYGEYIFGAGGNSHILKAYNMKTKKFTTLSSKNAGGFSDRAYGGYYYYPKYIAKASGNMNKYKIYKFNLKTGKSAPVSKTFTASSVYEVTCVEASYCKDNNYQKLYYLKY